MKKEFKVTGMSCSACQAHVEKAVGKLPVEKCVVNLLSNEMTVEYDENKVSPSEIILAVKKAGYGAEEKKTGQQNEETKEKEKRAERIKLVKLIVSIALTVIALYLSMAHMLKLPFHEFLHHHYLFQSIALFVIVCGVICINIRYFISGFSKLAKLAPNMDTLIAIGSSASFLYSIYLFVSYVAGGSAGDPPHLYLDASATILTLISLGKYFEGLSKKKTSGAIEKLMGMSPDTALVLKDGVETEVPVEQVSVGDILVVKDGMNFPVDGIVTEGNAGVNESLITGESFPVEKFEGEKVVSGTTVLNGYLKVRATEVGSDTTLSKIVKLVEEANATKAPVAKLADKVAGIFVPAVMGVALVVFAIWLIISGDFETALNYGVSVLVISCPCALGLATPVAIMVGTGKGAENGILIKSGEALQLLSEVKTVAFDKTGTLSLGQPTVTDIENVGGDASVFMSVVYAMESMSSHPLADAVCAKCEEDGVIKAEISDFSSENGKGLSATYNNVKYYIGNEKFAKEHGVLLSGEKEASAKTKSEGFAKEGKTPVFVFTDRLLGIIALRDELKKSSSHAVKRLNALGVECVMITGDNKSTAEAIAKAVGIDKVFAEILPDGKEKIVKELKEKGKTVAFVGDGVNDAPALNSADVGIAIGAGSDIAVESADIVLIKDDTNDVANAIVLSRKTMSNIKQNLFWAFFYNVLCIPVAAGALSFAGITLNPMFCALAMSLSSLFVVGNALRLGLVKTEKTANEKTATCRKEEGKTSDGDKKTNDKSPEKKEIEKMTYELKVNGMMCGHCEKSVCKALLGVDGVTDAKADSKTGIAVARTDFAVDENLLKKAVEAADYTVERVTSK
ncbi:MAG: heavy metal translocating P-type ATPase [Christensenellaceae bacterium]|nr:heavy metal translocating P-type ATPase [Christensenellaceae bacterium]